MLDARLTRWHAAARRHPALHRLAIVSRILLALAFVPTGLVKLLGWRFTVLDPATPIGGFFEAMYRTGAYWQFLGASQVAAGVLLLIPATATLGALAVLPIMLNITVITWALDFTGTRHLAVAMLLASLFLLGWDYDRWRGILVAPGQPSPTGTDAVVLSRLERAGYVLGTTAGLLLFAGTRGLVPGTVAAAGLVGGAGATGMVALAWWQAWRRG